MLLLAGGRLIQSSRVGFFRIFCTSHKTKEQVNYPFAQHESCKAADISANPHSQHTSPTQ